MPDSPDLDAARRALDAVPAPDLWDDAQRRAALGAAVPLIVAGERPPHTGRWLAVAAATVLTVGAVAVLAMNRGGQPVDTGPLAGVDDDGLTRFESGGCTFGVTHPSGGPPAYLSTESHTLTRFDDQPNVRLAAHRHTALVHVPGYKVVDLMGELVEEVELARGTAQLWSRPEFLQIRWFPSVAQQDPCESFTVTVGVGADDTTPDAPAVPTIDESRDAVVALAERIVLQSELPGRVTPATEVVAGEWQLERSTIDGVSWPWAPGTGRSPGTTAGPGLTFSFVNGQAYWTDGCNYFTGTYEGLGATTMRVVDIVSTATADCEGTPTGAAVRGVMGAEQIEVTPGSGRDIVVLSAGTTVLALRPIDPHTTTSSFVAQGEPIPNPAVGVEP